MGKKGKKKGAEDKATDLPVVVRTFYELGIVDLKKKIKRQLNMVEEFEKRNKTLKENCSQLTDDSNANISSIKRAIAERDEEINELCDKIKGIEESRIRESVEFDKSVFQMNEDYRLTHLGFHSEIKVLKGKINAIEEFRSLKDNLIKQLDEKQELIENSEEIHTNKVIELYKKFTTDKDNLRKEMEENLNQLSNDFQKTTAVCIVSSTRRVIRENIAIENEIDEIWQSKNRLKKENEQLAKCNRALKEELASLRVETQEILTCLPIQDKIIKQLQSKKEKYQEHVNQYEDIKNNILIIERQLASIKQENNTLIRLQKTLEQNLHASRCHLSTLRSLLQDCTKEFEALSEVMEDAILSVRLELTAKEDASNLKEVVKRRKMLLKSLKQNMRRIKLVKRKPSMKSVISVGDIYEIGDLGFVPPPVELRSEAPKRRYAETSIGVSFEDFTKQFVCTYIEKLTAEREVSKSMLDLTEEDVSVSLPKFPPLVDKVPCVFNESSEEEPSESMSEEVPYRIMLPIRPREVEGKQEEEEEEEEEEEGEGEEEEEEEEENLEEQAREDEVDG